MSSKNKLKVTLIVLIMVMSLFIFTSYIEYNRSYQNHVKETEDKLFIIKSNIESLITSRMIAINSLKSHIEIHEDFSQNDFNHFAKGIFDSSNDIVLRMSFLTDTTITHTYPFEENRGIVYTDLSLEEDKKEWINYAKSSLKPIIIAPVNIVKGGLGIVVRIPIEKEEEYYGQVSIVFDYDKTLEASGLIGFSENHYVQLVKTDELSNQEKVVWSNFPEVIIENKEQIINKVELYDSEMTLKAVPKDGFSGKSSLFYWILTIGGLITIVSCLIVYKLLSTTVALSDSEKRLKENNEELQALISQLKANEEQLYCQYEEIKEKKEYIQFLADYDYLTNLFNRRKFTEDISLNISSGDIGTILLFDVDNFKNINDTQGHRYGDQVLNYIACVLKKSLNKEGIVYRIGGDEFAVHLPGIIDNYKIELFINSFFDELKSDSYVESIKNHLTASVGIAKYPQDSSSTDDILMKSDIAMYQAKNDGKDRFCYFSHDLVSIFDNNIKIERELQDAIETDNFKLLYQAIVNVETGDIQCFEALLRIKNSILSPDEFIPVAENTGLIITIGNWVIDQVCKELRFWKDNNISIKPVAINISAKQLYDGSIVKYIKETLEKYNLEAYLIEIEITESVLIENTEYTIEILNKLRKMGIGISLDDFGTGYSSLSYLTYMPVDKVKIDKSLKDKFLFLEDVAVMEGIISICHGLKLQIVTEGVETREEFEQLKIYGSDFVQGYYFAKPISAEEATNIIDKNFL